jgi:hypothetical protein
LEETESPIVEREARFVNLAASLRDGDAEGPGTQGFRLLRAVENWPEVV